METPQQGPHPYPQHEPPYWRIPTEDLIRLYRELYEQNPNLSDGKLGALWRAGVKADPDLVDIAIDALRPYVHNWAFPPQPKPRPTRRKKKTASEAELQEFVRRAYVKAAFNQRMSNGKKLGDCTFKDIAGFGEAYAKLSTVGQPDQILRMVVKERDVPRIAGWVT